MKKYTLTEAIKTIEEKLNRIVLGIEYEDGSMKKFIVRLSGNNQNIFIDLSK